MVALELDALSWPQVRTEIDGGRDTIVIALGATEQHGRHLPLATDALLGDHFGRLLAERLDAFVGPTVRVGCSEHHVGFPGTMSLKDQTFHALVCDLVRSLIAGGFRKIVLLPTHGGNFAPLAQAVEQLSESEREHVAALTDLGALLEVARLGEREHGVPLGEGGLHAGEWETSMLLAIRPDLARMDEAEAGYTGDLAEGIALMFQSGVASLSPNGTIGDPAKASAAHGERYWGLALELALAQLAEAEAEA
jgi:creatinine amidohydrolase